MKINLLKVLEETFEDKNMEKWNDNFNRFQVHLFNLLNCLYLRLFVQKMKWIIKQHVIFILLYFYNNKI